MILSLAFGFVFFAFDPTARTALVGLAGFAAVGALLAYPELALALYVVVGDVKGDESVAALLPWDLTLALGGLLIAGMLLNLLRGKRVMALPGSYFLILMLVAMMAASLTYAPVFDAGAEKLARFLTVTGIVIIAPFFVLDSAAAMKRFLWGFSLVAFVICAYSLTSLGGSERLVTPSSNTIGLGHIACGLIVVIWFSVLPRLGFLKRMMLYPVLAVPMLALIGSGSRGAVLALGFVLLISVIFHRALLLDLGCMGALGLAAIPFVNIPQASFEYLGTLVNCQSVKALLFFRAELLTYGWTCSSSIRCWAWESRVFATTPQRGALQLAAQYLSGSELRNGFGRAGLLVIALFVLAIREAWRQLNDSESPYLALSQIAAALLLVGIVNATNTGDINSDRSTWLFLSIVYVVRGLRRESYRTQIRPVASLVPPQSKGTNSEDLHRMARNVLEIEIAMPRVRNASRAQFVLCHFTTVHNELKSRSFHMQCQAIGRRGGEGALRFARHDWRQRPSGNEFHSFAQIARPLADLARIAIAGSHAASGTGGPLSFSGSGAAAAGVRDENYISQTHRFRLL